MAIGTVKWFNNQKGYGFIQPQDGGKDVFVHISAVERAGLRTLVEGQRLSFEVQTERGRSAGLGCRREADASAVYRHHQHVIDRVRRATDFRRASCVGRDARL